jgi:glycosyltransferase involved in cell wall biosynthesis
MAEALIYPSFYEGFGLPIAEALLSQTPVIAANTSSLVEAGGPNSIYIDPNDADKLAIAMQNILNDEHIKIEMRKKGLEYALGKFSPNLVSSQLMKVYETLLS